MKKAFSLIEIMQTVILLGIIAGLSISFFKKMDTNDKLWNSTVDKITFAIQEANRQMCSDDVPTCSFQQDGIYRTVSYNTISAADANAMCDGVYPGSSYDSVKKACRIQYNIALPDGCPAPRTNGNTLGVAWNFNGFEPMHTEVTGGNRFCYATPPCLRLNSVPSALTAANSAIPYNYDTTSFKSVPLSEYTCFNNTPNYMQTITIGGNEYPVLCYYLHKILIHKPQGINATDDLTRTCAVFMGDGVTPRIPFTNTDPITPATVTAMVNAANGAAYRDNYNMLLSNGVYLYNLGVRTFPLNPNNEMMNNIYIKYDRNPNNLSARYVDRAAIGGGREIDAKRSTIGAISICNPTYGCDP